MDEILDSYVGGRFIGSDLMEIYRKEKKHISKPLYRCLYAHKDDIEKGFIMEWHGSTHWSYNKDYAMRYLDLDDLGYIADDDVTEFETANPGMDFDEILSTFFSPVVMMMETAEEGMDIGEVIEKYASEDAPVRRFLNEQEVSFIGCDFVITSKCEKDGITELLVTQAFRPESRA